ncbi:hypothetical protein SLEP1_g57233 [Rubroshorea leprosula]|uniref:Uncharacterized protein n=1 Tax=Rubroshorea leprosula TaxID=152421 RepID=A0AAV5MKU7_9ROSI|nr:hypothetical protein SLEP1_g57233 [Rubroshorea leprosula]
MKKHEPNVETQQGWVSMKPAWLSWSKPNLASRANPVAGFRRTQQGWVRATTSKVGFIETQPCWSCETQQLGFDEPSKAGFGRPAKLGSTQPPARLGSLKPSLAGHAKPNSWVRATSKAGFDGTQQIWVSSNPAT